MKDNENAVMTFEQFFLGELLAENIINEELFRYTLERFKTEKKKDKEEEMER